MASESTSPGAGDPLEVARAELRRLEAKLASITDPDVRGALSLRIRQIREEFPAVDAPPPKEASEEPVAEAEPATSAAEETLPPPPTPEQAEEAEKLIRQARVERMRGNKSAALELMKQAAAVAPGDAIVQEALGDDLRERRQMKEAREAYHRAHKLAPKNAALERKYAESVLYASGPSMSIEDQLRTGLSDTPFLTPGDAVAGSNAAIFFNALVPGVGQLVLGRTQKGLTFLGLWLVCLVGIVLLRHDFQELLKFVSGQSARPTLAVLLPIFGALGIYIAALADLKTGAKDARKTLDRPKPPVDLPFE